jgi:pimeloyl-ACP methyl ester carboxylesterase
MPRFWMVLGVAVAIVAAVAAAPAGIAWLFLHPLRRLHGRNPQSACGLAYERVRLCAEDGVSLSAWFIPATPARGVVVVCHGYSGNRATMLPCLKFLHHAGYAVVLFDFRAHGWSGGRMATFGSQEPLDLKAVLDWIESRPDLAGLPIALFGESMGASVALIVAAEEPRVRAVVADSPYARFDDAVEGRLRLSFGPTIGPAILPHMLRSGERMLGIAPDEIAPEEAVVRIAPRPVLLIHGLDDPLLTPDHSHRIRDAAPGNVELWEVPGSRHVGAIHDVPEEYARRVTAFLNRSLAG